MLRTVESLRNTQDTERRAMPHIDKDTKELSQRIFDAIVCAVDEEIAELRREDLLDPSCHDCDHVEVELRLMASAAAAGYFEAQASMSGMPIPLRRKVARKSHHGGMQARCAEHLQSCTTDCASHKVLAEELANQN
jgi:hypothetical protein